MGRCWKFVICAGKILWPGTKVLYMQIGKDAQGDPFGPVKDLLESVARCRTHFSRTNGIERPIIGENMVFFSRTF